jgi:hypothetical protein
MIEGPIYVESQLGQFISNEGSGTEKLKRRAGEKRLQKINDDTSKRRCLSDFLNSLSSR